MKKIKDLFKIKNTPKSRLKQAILDNNITLLTYYLNNMSVNINERDTNYHTLLDIACLNRRIEIMKLLVEYNARLGILLFQIESEAEFTAIIDDLHSVKYNLNNVDQLGFTPIYYAHIMGFSEVYNKLISYNAKELNINIKSQDQDNGTKSYINLIGNA